jgi:hypothetical protein
MPESKTKSALKVIRTLVKIVAVVVTVGFIINSFSGVLSALSLVDSKGLSTNPINHGDFVFNYSNQSIVLGVVFNNTGMYDVDGIILSISFDISNGSGWINVLSVKSTDLNASIPASGQIIKAGQLGIIGINAGQGNFHYDQFLSDNPGLNVSSWNLKNLLQEASSPWQARIVILFSVQYAFNQYELAANLTLTTSAVEGGL